MNHDHKASGGMNGLTMMLLMVVCCAGVFLLFALGPFIGWPLTFAIVGVAMIGAMGAHFWKMRSTGEAVRVESRDQLRR